MHLWARIIEQPEDWPAAEHPGDDPEQAAGSEVVAFLEATGGTVTHGTVRVWVEEDGAGGGRTFDWIATIELPDPSGFDPDVETEIEAEVTIALVERPGGARRGA